MPIRNSWPIFWMEFMSACIVDSARSCVVLQEDLNRVKKKQLVPKVESDGKTKSDVEVRWRARQRSHLTRPSDSIQVAAEAWEGHLKRNRSVIVDLFMGQLK